MKNKTYAPILVILLIFFLVNFFSLFSTADLWWDSAVYVGMGKFIYSVGQLGIWEASRPIFWPLILGLYWKIGLDPIFFGKITLLFFSTFCILFTYLIAKEVFSHKVAFLSSIFLALSSTFFLFTSILHSEIPSLFFLLLGTYLFIHKDYQLSGLFFGLSILSRFFAFFAVMPFFFYLFYRSIQKKSLTHTLSFSLSFLIPILPYLILNQFLYQDLLYPFYLQSYLTNNTGMIFYQPFYFYFIGLLKENFLVVFSLLGIWYILRKKHPDSTLVLFVFLFSFVPFNLTHHKEMRLIISSLPFLFIITSEGILRFLAFFKKKKVIVLSLLIAIFFLQAIPQLHFNDYEDSLDVFYDYVAENSLDSPIWISNPSFIAYSDYNAELLYYPKIDKEKILLLESELPMAQNILLDTCDLACQPPDPECESLKEDLISELKQAFTTSKYEKKWLCERYIFTKQQLAPSLS